MFDTDFELYQVFVHNVLGQNVWIFPLYLLLTRRIKTFWSKVPTLLSIFSTTFPQLYHFPTLFEFLSLKNGSILFSHLLASTDSMLQALTLYLYRFQMLRVVLRCFITRIHRSEMNNSFMTSFIKIKIIKVNIIKICFKNTYFITRKCDITRIFIKKRKKLYHYM